MSVGTWNIRSLKEKKVELIEEFETQMEVMKISETKKKNKRLREIGNGYATQI